MTISELIEKLQNIVGSYVDIKYVHPTLYIICVDETFEGQDSDARKESFFSKNGISLSDVLGMLSSPIIEFLFLTSQELIQDYSYLDKIDGRKHWLAAFNPVQWNKKAHSISKRVDVNDGVKAVHFYGYKGGQARSTVLLVLAKSLADLGYRVLLVDADIEAPSLDSMLGVVADDSEQTLIGLSEFDTKISPISSAYVGALNVGQIDLLPCRPVAAKYDMDFAAFLLNSSLDANLLKNSVEKLRTFVNISECEPRNSRYDVVFFDHRTGLAPSVLPIMEAWPGSAVIFIRPDGMARHIQESFLLDSLLSYDSEAPGAFVSFSLDPKKTTSIARTQHGRTIESLLEKISDALNRCSYGDDEDEPIDPAELERYWVFWRHDQRLVDGQHPDPSEMSTENKSALSQLRSILGFNEEKITKSKVLPLLSSSGGPDEGQFILTPDFAKLFSIDSPYTYIFGRKGTGKTRLCTELSRNSLAEPLLVASDFQFGGLRSSDIIFTKVLVACENSYETFWWILLDAALDCENTKGENLTNVLKSWLADGKINSETIRYISSVETKAAVLQSRRIFLLDGIETAVPAANLRPFVESLFRFLSTIQYNKDLSNAFVIRLFLRLDLYKGFAQNVEQQVEGHLFVLHWDKTAILNFALARLNGLAWFAKSFPEVCNTIEKHMDLITRGALSDDVAESLLLRIFPSGLERNKLKTTTFFATYFSDAGGDEDRNATFYPRLFDGFLKVLARKCESDLPLHNSGDLLPSKIVLEAYDKASKDFIVDVRTELQYFLNIEEDEDRNKDAIDNLINAFNGLRTPFVLDEIVSDISSRANIAKEKARKAVENMKSVGIFEERPGYAGEWRTGRLYKAGLGMKYGRVREKK